MTELLEPGDDRDVVRFGRARLIASSRPILEHEVSSIVCPANRRGVMGVGIAGAIRMAGGIEIEREAMAKAPLGLGTAVATSAGLLEQRGVTIIIHAVVSDALGSPTRADIVRHATIAALRIADANRVKSIGMPPLGSGVASFDLTGAMVFALMIEEIVAHLRRFTSRLERVVLVCRDDREVREIRNIMRAARELWDGLRV
jgi:O-acetyl-ADP-ribose deacetylase (regulator of RNase III)